MRCRVLVCACVLGLCASVARAGTILSDSRVVSTDVKRVAVDSNDDTVANDDYPTSSSATDALDHPSISTTNTNSVTGGLNFSLSATIGNGFGYVPSNPGPGGPFTGFMIGLVSAGIGLQNPGNDNGNLQTVTAFSQVKVTEKFTISERTGWAWHANPAQTDQQDAAGPFYEVQLLDSTGATIDADATDTPDGSDRAIGGTIDPGTYSFVLTLSESQGYAAGDAGTTNSFVQIHNAVFDLPEPTGTGAALFFAMMLGLRVRGRRRIGGL